MGLLGAVQRPALPRLKWSLLLPLSFLPPQRQRFPSLMGTKPKCKSSVPPEREPLVKLGTFSH